MGACLPFIDKRREPNLRFELLFLPMNAPSYRKSVLEAFIPLSLTVDLVVLNSWITCEGVNSTRKQRGTGLGEKERGYATSEREDI